MNQDRVTADSNFLKLIEVIKARQDADYDATIILSGAKGVGKSTLALNIAKALDGEQFDVRRTLAFSTEEVIKKSFTVPEKTTIINDEAIRAAYNLDFSKKENKELDKVLQTIRTRNLCYVLCIPSFWKIQKGIRDTINLWIHVVDRGFAVVFKKDDGVFSEDVWHFRDSKKRTEKLQRIFTDYYIESDDLSLIENTLGKLPTFKMVVKFQKAEDKLYNEYKEIRDTMVKRHALKERHNKWKERYLALCAYLEDNNVMPNIEIAKASQIGEKTYYRIKNREAEKELELVI